MISSETDLIPGLAAFFACLVLPLQIGILVGIGINIVFILYHAARPKLRVEKLTVCFHKPNIFLKYVGCLTVNIFLQTTDGINYIMLTPDRCIIFPSVEFVRSVINKQGMKTTLPVVVDCTHIYGADYTAAKVVATMIQDFESRKQKIYFYNLKLSVAQVFGGVTPDIIQLYDMTALEAELRDNA